MPVGALAGMVETFYIIGGRHASNSVRLLAVCKEQCEKSFLIETEDEINAEISPVPNASASPQVHPRPSG